MAEQRTREQFSLLPLLLVRIFQIIKIKFFVSRVLYEIKGVDTYASAPQLLRSTAKPVSELVRGK